MNRLVWAAAGAKVFQFRGADVLYFLIGILPATPTFR